MHRVLLGHGLRRNHVHRRTDLARMLYSSFADQEPAPRIFGMQFSQLAKKLFGFFVAHFRRLRDYLHDLIATEFLRVLGTPRSLDRASLFCIAGRNFEQRLAVNGRHFDFGAKARFPDAGRRLPCGMFCRRHAGRRGAAGRWWLCRDHRESAPMVPALPGPEGPEIRLSAGRNPHFDELLAGDSAHRPWQPGRAFYSPLPLQRGQVRLNFILPAICDT